MLLMRPSRRKEVIIQHFVIGETVLLEVTRYARHQIRITLRFSDGRHLNLGSTQQNLMPSTLQAEIEHTPDR
jgi:hypothetical protein